MRERARYLGGAALLYVAAALAATWPALRHFGSASLAGGAPGYGEMAHGDYLQTGYRLWLFGHQLGGGHAPWLDPLIFQPESPHQVGLGGWPFGLLVWPVYAAFDPVVAWNVFTLLAIAGAGALTWWWLRELGIGRGAALVGGLAFALAPYRLEQSTGHLLGPISLLLPLTLACFERGLRGGKRGWLVGAGLALVSLPLSGQVHLALGAVPFFALYALCRTRDRGALTYAAGAVALAAGAGLLVQRTVIAHSIVAGGRDFHALQGYSAGALDLVSRTRRHGSEQFAFLGWLTVALALAGLVLLLRERRRGLALALGLGAVLPAAAALGSNLPLYRFAWHHLFVLRYARVPERTLPIACLCIAALAALAIEWASRRTSRGTLAVALLGALVIVDLHVTVFHASAADRENGAYTALRSQPAGRLLELPVFLPSNDLGSVYLGYELQARRQRPLGYSTLAPPSADRAARTLWPLNCGGVGSRQRALLRRFNVRFVILHRGLYFKAGHREQIAFAELGLKRAGFSLVAGGGEIELWGLAGNARNGSGALPPSCAGWERRVLD